jgi:hypothetical protein
LFKEENAAEEVAVQAHAYFQEWCILFGLTQIKNCAAACFLTF